MLQSAFVYVQERVHEASVLPHGGFHVRLEDQSLQVLTGPTDRFDHFHDIIYVLLVIDDGVHDFERLQICGLGYELSENPIFNVLLLFDIAEAERLEAVFVDALANFVNQLVKDLA